MTLAAERGTFPAAGPIIAATVPAVLVVVTGVLLTGRVPAEAFLAVAVLAGLPHGAFDHEVGRRAFVRAHGARWWWPFLTGYLMLLGATLLLWWAAPSLALTSFLLLSAYHFADAEAPIGASVRPMRLMAHGGAVIIVTAAAFPGIVTHLFGMLAPAGAPWIEAALSGPLLVLWAAATIGTLGVYVQSDRPQDLAAAINLVLVSLLFAVVPPLIAFSLYFAVLHAPRALAALRPAADLSGSAPWVPIVLTLLAAAFGVALYRLGSDVTATDNTIRAVFILLSALTVPHMWLEWRARSAAAN